MFLDRQNYLIYGEIVFLVAFLFFLVKGIDSIKSGDYKIAIMCFITTIIIMAGEIMKILMWNGAF